MVIDPVQGEIALVLRPFPVVLVAAEGCDGHRRRAHQADVLIGGVKGQVVFLPGPHGIQRGFQARARGIAALQDGGELPRAEALAPGGQRVRHGRHLVRHVQDPLQEVHFLSLERNLVLAVKRPVAVLQVVFLRGGQVEQVTVGAVVVGDEEPLVGNHAGRAVKAQRHDGVGDRGPRRVGIVNLPGGELQPPLLHLLFQGLVQGVDHPHPLIGGSGQGNQQGQGQKQSFHLLFVPDAADRAGDAVADLGAIAGILGFRRLVGHRHKAVELEVLYPGGCVVFGIVGDAREG